MFEFDPTTHLTRHVTSRGTRFYVMSIRAFAHLSVNSFLVVEGDPHAPTYMALIDTGTNETQSRLGLIAGLEAIRRDYGEQWSWASLSRLIVTHAHPDHAAGLPWIRTQTDAPLAAHEWGRLTLEDPQGDLAQARPLFERYVAWTGVTGSYAQRLGRRAQRSWMPSGVPVETLLQDGHRLDDRFDIIHTPGHEGSQVCLRLDNFLLTADHLLPFNSPPLMPEWVRRGGGLSLYLSSLDKIEPLAGIDLALGGHDAPMPHWRQRITDLRGRYEGKLAALLEAADVPQTTEQLMLRLYPSVREAQAILLIDQTAALAEYLLGQGKLSLVGSSEVPARFVRSS